MMIETAASSVVAGNEHNMIQVLQLQQELKECRYALQEKDILIDRLQRKLAKAEEALQLQQEQRGQEQEQLTEQEADQEQERDHGPEESSDSSDHHEDSHSDNPVMRNTTTRQQRCTPVARPPDPEATNSPQPAQQPSGPAPQPPQQQQQTGGSGSGSVSFDFDYAIDEFSQWLYREGGHMEDMKSFITSYTKQVRTLGLPLERLFIGGQMLHPKVSAYIWKWQLHTNAANNNDNDNTAPEDDSSDGGGTIKEFEMPREMYEKRRIMFKGSPFCLLQDEGLSQIRIRLVVDGEGKILQPKPNQIPKDCNWLIEEHYTDYIALPLKERGKYIGGMAWSTKHSEGFSPLQITFLEVSLAALTIVMRLHTNELVRTALMAALEVEMHQRTTALSQANAALQQVNQRIEDHSARQLMAFSCISHEIRTPLNCIIGLTDDLLASLSSSNSSSSSSSSSSPQQQQQQPNNQQQQQQQQQRESLKMISRSGDVLLRLINDFLNFSRLHSGEEVLVEMAPTRLMDTLNTVLTAIRIKASTRGIAVKMNCGNGSGDKDQLPQWIETDRDRLQQVLFNVLGNAIKFSHTNGIVELTVESKSSSSSSGHNAAEGEQNTCSSTSDESNSSSSSSSSLLVFKVKDYGRGIEKHDLPKIFEPFNQASKDTQALYGGTGLGLAITHKIVVQGLKGTVAVDSQWGSWTEFTVSIPIRKVEQQQQQETSLQSSSSPSTTTVPMYSMDSSAMSRSNITRRRSISRNMSCTQHLCERLSDFSFSTAKDGAANSSDNDNNNNNNIAGKKNTISYSSMRVLIAEDNLVNQKVLRKTLQRLGMEKIDIVDNGRKAVDAVISNVEQDDTQQKYDVIFMDWQMPILDGLDATVEIKDYYKLLGIDWHQQAKVVFVTAHAAESFVNRAEEAGADGFISKPLKLDKIDQMLKSLLPIE